MLWQCCPFCKKVDSWLNFVKYWGFGIVGQVGHHPVSVVFGTCRNVLKPTKNIQWCCTSNVETPSWTWLGSFLCNSTAMPSTAWHENQIIKMSFDGDMAGFVEKLIWCVAVDMYNCGLQKHLYPGDWAEYGDQALIRDSPKCGSFPACNSTTIPSNSRY